MRRAFMIISVLLVMISTLSAQINIRIDKIQIEKTVKRMKDSLNIPGIAVGIAVGNEIKYVNVLGYANLETKTPLEINSLWHICSVSKQFSTVVCLKLVEENKLSLQDKISKYIDNLPDEFSNVTIFSLLSQTSGIKDYMNDKDLYGLPWEKVKAGVFSDTLNDLLRWNIALTQGKIINQESISKLWTPTKLNNGKTLEISPNSGVNYGLGWFMKSVNGDKVVWTPGAGFGFSISSQYIPKYKLTMIIFCNKEQFLMADEVGFSITKTILD